MWLINNKQFVDYIPPLTRLPLTPAPVPLGSRQKRANQGRGQHGAPTAAGARSSVKTDLPGISVTSAGQQQPQQHHHHRHRHLHQRTTTPSASHSSSSSNRVGYLFELIMLVFLDDG